VLGSTVGKMFLKSGETSEIINLAEMKIYDLNHKKKEFAVRPIAGRRRGFRTGLID